MASSGAVGGIALIVPVFVPLTVASAAYAVRAMLRLDWTTLLRRFFTGPGRVSRILLLFFVLTNTKSMPLAWSARVFGAMARHVVCDRRPLPPRALFHPAVTSTRTSLLETDYNVHKSNSTYFSDLDVARTQAVMHLMRPGMKALGANARTKLVRDPTTGSVAEGAFGIGLGATFCSFRRELAPYAGYEMWTRVLAWDRKWLYVVTHFVVAGKVRPTAWDGAARWGAWGKVRGPAAGKKQANGGANGSANGSAHGAVDGSAAAAVEAEVDARSADFQKHVIATAVSKYVFKLGRLTVHPSVVIGASGLLPERPGGEESWRGGPAGVGDDDEAAEAALAGLDAGPVGAWDWRHTERERRRGMEFAENFAALDDMHALFDGGEDGALGRFSPG